MGAIEAKKWELVIWNGTFYAVGLELKRGNLDIVMTGRSRQELHWFMERMPGWEPRQTSEDVYDMDRAKGTNWDGRKDRPGTRRKRY